MSFRAPRFTVVTSLFAHEKAPSSGEDGAVVIRVQQSLAPDNSSPLVGRLPCRAPLVQRLQRVHADLALLQR